MITFSNVYFRLWPLNIKNIQMCIKMKAEFKDGRGPSKGAKIKGMATHTLRPWPPVVLICAV